MIPRINEPKTLTKHIPRECKCKFDRTKCNSNQKWNNDKCQCGYKNLKAYHVCKKDYVLNPATYTCKNAKYLVSTIDDSVDMSGEIIEATKTISTKTIPTKSTSTNVYILLAF